MTEALPMQFRAGRARATVPFDLSDLSLDFLIRDNHGGQQNEDVKGKAVWVKEPLIKSGTSRLW